MSITLDLRHVRSCKYKIEGGKHVLFDFSTSPTTNELFAADSTDGAACSQFQNKILRVPKSDSHASIKDGDVARAWDRIIQDQYRAQMHEIFSLTKNGSLEFESPLPDWFAPVAMPSGAQYCLQQEMERGRHTHQSNRKERDLALEQAMLMPDFSRLHNHANSDILSIEIKPKCGILHRDMRQNQSHQGQDMIKNRIHSCVEHAKQSGISIDADTIEEFIEMYKALTHFAFKQRFRKLYDYQGKQSQYDPTDLFSDQEDRKLQAVQCLFADPQNNLRMFWNGSQVDVEQLKLGSSSALSEPYDLLTSRLLEKWIVGALTLHHDVLQRLVELQDCAPCSLEEMQALYSRALELDPEDACVKNAALFGSESSHPSSFPDKEVVCTISKIAEFLLSRTVMDCSIFIAFELSRAERFGGGSDLVILSKRLVLLDIYPLKSISKIPVFLAQEMKLIIDALTRYTEYRG